MPLTVNRIVETGGAIMKSVLSTRTLSPWGSEVHDIKAGSQGSGVSRAEIQGPH